MSSGHVFRFSWVGLLLVILGVLFLGDQMDLLDFGAVVNVWWPAILVMIGLCRLASGRGLRLSGWILMGLGALLILRNLDVLPFSLWHLWPILLIVLGLSMLLRGRGPRPSSTNEDVVNHSVLFGGQETAVRSPAFRGGTINSAFGSVKLDLRGATPVPEGAQIHVNAVFGGAELRVPPTWDVQLDGAPIFGGFSDERHHAETPPGSIAPVLRVRGMVLFGGVSVKD